MNMHSDFNLVRKKINNTNITVSILELKLMKIDDEMENVTYG